MLEENDRALFGKCRLHRSDSIFNVTSLPIDSFNLDSSKPRELNLKEREQKEVFKKLLIKDGADPKLLREKSVHGEPNLNIGKENRSEAKHRNSCDNIPSQIFNRGKIEVHDRYPNRTSFVPLNINAKMNLTNDAYGLEYKRLVCSLKHDNSLHSNRIPEDAKILFNGLIKDPKNKKADDIDIHLSTHLENPLELYDREQKLLNSESQLNKKQLEPYDLLISNSCKGDSFFQPDLHATEFDTKTKFDRMDFGSGIKPGNQTKSDCSLMDSKYKNISLIKKIRSEPNTLNLDTPEPTPTNYPHKTRKSEIATPSSIINKHTIESSNKEFSIFEKIPKENANHELPHINNSKIFIVKNHTIHPKIRATPDSSQLLKMNEKRTQTTCGLSDCLTQKNTSLEKSILDHSQLDISFPKTKSFKKATKSEKTPIFQNKATSVSTELYKTTVKSIKSSSTFQGFNFSEDQTIIDQRFSIPLDVYKNKEETIPKNMSMFPTYFGNHANYTTKPFSNAFGEQIKTTTLLRRIFHTNPRPWPIPKAEHQIPPMHDVATATSRHVYIQEPAGSLHADQNLKQSTSLDELVVEPSYEQRETQTDNVISNDKEQQCFLYETTTESLHSRYTSRRNHSGNSDDRTRTENLTLDGQHMTYFYLGIFTMFMLITFATFLNGGVYIGPLQVPVSSLAKTECVYNAFTGGYTCNY